ncbi:MAG: hypothetical protein JWM59_3670 [Verrucomicrobiales bacterium]|nr:hypothetical protein [Verrucomicrobiales bacterium]
MLTTAASMAGALTVRTLLDRAPRRLEDSTPPAAAEAAQMPDAFLKTWCLDCHGDGAKKGGLSLDDPAALTERAWENIRRHVLLHTMPPPDEPAPGHAQREDFETALSAWRAGLPDANRRPAPVRRLSRMEFARSLEMLLGVPTETVLTELPEDETAHGFDNNGDLQPLPAARMERYLSVISQTADAAMLPPPVPSRSQRVMAADFTGGGGLFPDAPQFYVTTSGKDVRVRFHTPVAGRYRWSVVLYGHTAGYGPPMLQLGDSPPQAVWRRDRDNPQLRTVTLDLPAGKNVLTWRLANPLTDPANPDPHRRMRRLLVRESSLDGPLEGDTTPSPRFVEKFGPVPGPQASMEERVRAAHAALTKFTRLAWRHPATLDESLRLLSLTGSAMANGLRYDEALSGTVQAILASPAFLFLTDPAQAPPDRKNQAVAARLSYFLTSRPPDDGLLAACPDSGADWTPDQLAEAGNRLLDSGEARAFALDFAGQWLQLRNTALASPDKTLFPQATREMRAAMLEESTRFFLSLVRENAPVLSLLTADRTSANDRLAAFYGLPAPGAASPEFTQMDVPPERHGLLGQASVLMLTSYPNRTSPVLRGKYILETLLGLEPPPPPPNVPSLNPSAGHGHGPGADSVRAVLERHRADPGCAPCHRAIDPLGFPLEAWNAIGLPDPGAASATGPSTVFTGETLTQPADLTRWLVERQGTRIVRHAAERLLTYALGRGLSAPEKETARRLADQAGGREARFRDLILAVVRSAPFRGEPGPG